MAYPTRSESPISTVLFSPKRASVISVDIGPLAENSGFYGQLSRLSLRDDLHNSTAPRSIIAKFPSTTLEMNNRPGTIFAYEREVRSYQEIASLTTLPTPACYYGDIDTETGTHVLLLEDLAPAVSGSRVAGCSPNQAELTVRHIARFHADWWESPQLNKKSWLSNARDPYHDPDAARIEYEGWRGIHREDRTFAARIHQGDWGKLRPSSGAH